MRLTARITSTSTKWNPRFPEIGDFKDFLVPDGNGNNRFDHRAASAALADPANFGLVTFTDGDTPLVILISCMLVNEVQKWMDRNEIDRADADAVNKRLERHHRNGKEALCRVTIVRCRDDNTARIRIDSKDNDVIQRRHWERIFAGILAEHLANVCADAQRNLGASFFVDKSVGEYAKELADLREELRREDEIRKLNDGRTVCDHFSHGYCAPCKFDCPCYKDGKCVEAK